METGCRTKPTRRSETAILHRKMVEGERSEGVLDMAANTKQLLMTEISISGAFRTRIIKDMLSILLTLTLELEFEK